jgi:hypothetical protein
MVKFSLLHATYRAGDDALANRSAWLASASNPDEVEHIFAADGDDPTLPVLISGAGRVVINPPTGRVTAVRNWNAAAAAAHGEVLVVIADDLWPCHAWDLLLRELWRDLDPLRAPFVINVSDEERADWLIRHPVVSRDYYGRFGLWNSAFDGYGVDKDFTFRANLRGIVIDGTPTVHFDHRRSPTDEPAKIRSTMPEGQAILSALWPQWKQRVWRRALRPRSGQRNISQASLATRSAIARLGWARTKAPILLLKKITGRAARR